MNADGSFDLAAEAADAAMQLHLVPQKTAGYSWQEGISQKAEGNGHASHYYSITRLATTGEVRGGERKFHGQRRKLVRSRMGHEPARAGAGRMELDLGPV